MSLERKPSWRRTASVHRDAMLASCRFTGRAPICKFWWEISMMSRSVYKMGWEHWKFSKLVHFNSSSRYSEVDQGWSRQSSTGFRISKMVNKNPKSGFFAEHHQNFTRISIERLRAFTHAIIALKISSGDYTGPFWMCHSNGTRLTVDRSSCMKLRWTDSVSESPHV